MAKDLQGDALVKRAEELGADILGEPRRGDGFRKTAPDHVLQARVIEAESHQRQDRLWIVAVVSSAAAVISSLTALVALFWHR